jgi:hypothetical protein
MMDTEPQITPPPTTTAQPFQQCEECGAPVEAAQRYCVNCGAHRRHVQDPAARYLSQASGRARSGPVRRGATAVRRRGGGWAAAAVLAVIPVAAAIGVVVGRSSNNQDTRLVQALDHQIQALDSERAQVGAASSSAGSSSSGSTTASTGTKSKGHKTTTKKASKSASAKTVATKNGSVSKIAGSKVTSSQEQQGASEAKNVQNSTGKNYVNADNNLPSQVVVGP